jgi:TolB-like protein/class 3 adenylate cyclase
MWKTGEVLVAREQRRLAAIVAADVVGYSRLMGWDESGTVARLREHRKQRFEPSLARHGGRLVKLTGDGALAEFPSAVDALSAAIEFQQSMLEANSDQPEDTAIVFRIGLHLGDLIVDGDDLYGDGVNVAARLEAAAPAGGIVISGNVHDAVAGRLKTTFDDLGTLALKNIQRPLQAFGVKWDPADWKVSPVTTPLQAAEVPLTLPDKPSIAVLPFQNMSGDPEQEYFAEGLAEEIITALSGIKSLFVIARESSFTYRGHIGDVKRVGRELGVRYLLEGSVRTSLNNVRITSQLTDVETGSHVWASRFDGRLDDIFTLQDQVASGILGAVLPALDRAEVDRVQRKPVKSIAAYDCYLQGIHQAYRQTGESWEAALEYFLRAIELDPEFAAPYAMAMRAYATRHQLGRSIGRKGDEARVRRLADQVSLIGREDAQVLCGAGFALAYLCHEFERGAALIEQGLAINQNLAVGWQMRGFVSLWQGRNEAAIDQIARAMRLNPRDPEVFRSELAMAIVSLRASKFAEAVDWATRALTHHPHLVPAISVAVAANALAGRTEEAGKLVQRLRKIRPTANISYFRQVIPHSAPKDIENWMTGLRLAGLPE